MLDWYVSLVRSKATELLSLTDILVADAFFPRYEFVNEVIGMGFRFVGRLRADSYLRYLAIPDPSAPCRRGRKKMYGEKVDFSNLDVSVFTSFIYEDSKVVRTRCHTAVVHSRALKRDIRIVVCPVENGEPLLYFSTDTAMKPERIICLYRTRFQIEFGIRDAKQFTGL
ncbi:MAG: transposase [Bacteroides sp.]|nr:transposase [Bacteroides sp.]